MNFFGISDDDFFNKDKIKIILGIAGSAKSSNIHKILSDAGIKYLRATSTHRLKGDAERRFEIPCVTIAGGLFSTEEGRFFYDYKNPAYETVVIDEVLQTNKRVFEWCREYVGTCNIIITTDEKQMLSVGGGSRIVEELHELKEDTPCVWVELSKSYRPVNSRTEELYNKLYKLVDSEKPVWYQVRDGFKQIDFSEMEVNPDDIYICHTNDIEVMLYNERGLNTAYDMPLIPKGQIAKKMPENVYKYPICPQSKVDRGLRSYLQIANVASPTRYQGSEVEEGQKLYYLVERKSFVTNRELYTVVTRCKDVSSLVIVWCMVDDGEYMRFCGKPIVDEQTWFIDELTMPDGRLLSEMADRRDGKALLLTDEEIVYVKSQMPDVKGVYYNDEFFVCNGALVRPGKGDEVEEAKNRENKNTPTIQSLLAKEPELELSYGERAYHIVAEFRENQIDYLGGAVARTWNGKGRDEYRYEIDLFSSYAHILNNEKIPIDGKIYLTEDKRRVNYYIYQFNAFEYELMPCDCLITDSLKEIVDMFPGCYAKFLFSVDCKRGSRVGKWGVENSLKSSLKKQIVKSIRWGYLAQPLYDGHEVNGEIDYYIRNKKNNTELLMIHIRSVQLAMMLSVQMAIYGNLDEGCIIADALHYDAVGGGVEVIADLFKNRYPGYHYRITDKVRKEVVFKTYNEPKDKKQLDAERARRYRTRKKS